MFAWTAVLEGDLPQTTTLTDGTAETAMSYHERNMSVVWAMGNETNTLPPCRPAIYTDKYHLEISMRTFLQQPRPTAALAGLAGVDDAIAGTFQLVFGTSGVATPPINTHRASLADFKTAFGNTNFSSGLQVQQGTAQQGQGGWANTNESSSFKFLSIRSFYHGGEKNVNEQLSEQAIHPSNHPTTMCQFRPSFNTCCPMSAHAHTCTRMHTHAHACTRMHTHAPPLAHTCTTACRATGTTRPHCRWVGQLDDGARCVSPVAALYA
jgi:hypothetical protein